MADTVAAQDAKQARKGLPVLAVLIVGIFLALGVWFGTEIVFSGPENSLATNELPAAAE